ncbi:hypothetical protein GIB67_017789 [Kingdonia uniflora]|uniref:DNA-directed DNA polymerase n=1 Tax=Kingdonia uniflora TaxID=39325 RepID=A0A7J7MP37_9MAGN|nr:hypothetical protein GIB67_017789 [Kingdonia uniflora]
MNQAPVNGNGMNQDPIVVNGVFKSKGMFEHSLKRLKSVVDRLLLKYAYSQEFKYAKFTIGYVMKVPPGSVKAENYEGLFLLGIYIRVYSIDMVVKELDLTSDVIDSQIWDLLKIGVAGGIPQEVQTIAGGRRRSYINYITAIKLSIKEKKFFIVDDIKTILINSIHKPYAAGFVMLYRNAGYVKDSDWKPPKNFVVQIAAAITAYARIYMYQFTSRDNCYYTDIDSAILGKPLLEELVSSTVLGLLKLECFVKAGIFLAPKCYKLVIEDDKKVIKHKGPTKNYVNADWFQSQYEKPSTTQNISIESNFRIDWHTLNIAKKVTQLSLRLQMGNKRDPVYDENDLWIDTVPKEVLDLAGEDTSVLKIDLQMIEDELDNKNKELAIKFFNTILRRMAHYNPFDNLQSPGNNSSSNASSKKKRGLARDSKPLPNGKKKKIDVNSWGQPNQANSETNTYTSDIGFQVRMHLPIIYESFKHVPNDRIALVVKGLEVNFYKNVTISLTLPGLIKKKKLKMLGEGDVKASSAPEFVPRDDWVKFVDYCNSEKFLAKSKKNKENRAKLIAPCTLGRTSMSITLHKLKFGKERNGGTRGMGAGMSISLVEKVGHIVNENEELRSNNNELKFATERLRKYFDALTKYVGNIPVISLTDNFPSQQATSSSQRE